MKNEENSKIEKPTILKIEEFRDKLAICINSSELASYDVIPIVEDFLNQLRQLNAQFYESEKQRYESQLKEMEEKNGDDRKTK